MKVTLREFVENFVAPNSICRLWIPYVTENTTHRMVLGVDKRETFMNWELLKGEVPQSMYLDCTFHYVTDIFSDKCREAINLCVTADKVKEELYKPNKRGGEQCIG